MSYNAAEVISVGAVDGLDESGRRTNCFFRFAINGTRETGREGQGRS